MAYRCKCCGYVFKKSDSDLCPECFTAREDIDCTSFGEQHNHFKDSSDEKDSFLAEQLKQEAAATPEEMGEKIHDVTDGIKRTFSQDTPPNTYSKAPQTPPQNNGQKMYYTTGVGGSRYYTNSNFTNQQYQPVGNRNQTRKAPGWLIAILLLMFFMPFITTFIGIVSSIRENAKNAGKSNFDDLSITDASIEEQPDENAEPAETSLQFASQDVLDEELFLTVSNIRLAETCSCLEECKALEIADFPTYNEEEFEKERKCYVLLCDINIDSEGYSFLDTCFLSIDDADTIYYEPLRTDSSTESYKTYQDYPIIITPECEEYMLYFSASNDNDSEDRHIFNCCMTPSYLLELVGVDDPELSAKTVTDNAENRYDYSYIDEPFVPSLKDSTGRNIQLKYTGNSAEMNATTPENEYLMLIDETLKDDTWALYETTLVSADASHAALNCRFKSVTLTGYDSNNLEVCIYEEQLNGDLPELPMCKTVQYYCCVIDYVEASGTTGQAKFYFSTSDLYNS